MTSGLVDAAADTVKEGVKAATGQKTPPPMPSLAGQMAVVTGANSGLGYDASLAFAKAGAHVVLACRNLDKGREAVRQIETEVRREGSGGSAETRIVDLANLRSVYDFARGLHDKKQPINILINNAGEFAPEDDTTVDGFEVTVGTNHFGPWYLTQLLADLCKAGRPSRMVWTTSPSETVTPDIDFSNLEARGHQSDVKVYGLTKLYNILSMKEFHKRLLGQGVEVFAAQPGVAATGIFGKLDSTITKPFATIMRNVGPFVGQSSEEGAKSIIHAATSPDMTGKGGDENHIVGPLYFKTPGLPHGGAQILNVGNTEERPARNPRAYDDQLAARLYEETGKIISSKINTFDNGRRWL